MFVATFVSMDEQHLENWLNKRKLRRDNLSAITLFEQISQQNIEALSSAITLIESSREEDQQISDDLISLCLPFTGKAIRIGITGVPGVGKSTFIEAFGNLLVEKGYRVAVLAIDPSSGSSGGSILGDKTRMHSLSVNPNVFIRPSAAGQTLGGVARKTRESILLCETAGFEIVLVETVGVGQSETLVHSMVDFFLLLMLSGAGDELQGIKRGIMEMADALVITKADGENEKKAKLASREYANALHLFPKKKSDWIAPAFTCSAVDNKNIDKVWETVESFVLKTRSNGWFMKNRRNQEKYWLNETLRELILREYFSNEEFLKQLEQTERSVLAGEKTAFQAAELLFSNFTKK